MDLSTLSLEIEFKSVHKVTNRLNELIIYYYSLVFGFRESTDKSVSVDSFAE